MVDLGLRATGLEVNTAVQGVAGRGYREGVLGEVVKGQGGRWCKGWWEGRVL